MSAIDAQSQGRYLLFLDILGFSELVKTKGEAEVLGVIKDSLKAFDSWEIVNDQFRTIYFSDTFLYYQVNPGYGDWAFLDIYAIGALVLTNLLSKGIAARGAITFGRFDVHDDVLRKHQVYFGPALIEAYQAEKKEGWIGITIQPSAWKPYEASNPGTVTVFQNEKVWLKRSDDVLLLNPFIKLRGWHIHDLIGEIDVPYSQWDQPDFPNEIKAFKFLRDKVGLYSSNGDFTGRVASKYHATNAFLKQVFGPELYSWACKISDEVD